MINLIKQNMLLRGIYAKLRLLYYKSKSSLEVKNEGRCRLYKHVIGGGNKLIVNKMCTLLKTTIHIVGNNNTIEFEEGCSVGEHCSFWCEGNNITIHIGAHTTFTHSVHFCAQEDNMRIDIGEDCMFSNTITVRTSDSHIILDNEGNRINPGKSVKIGKHVWLAPKSMVMKGVTIGDNVIIGTNAMVTKDIPSNCLAVGQPAKVVKTGMNWTRQAPFELNPIKVLSKQ